MVYLWTKFTQSLLPFPRFCLLCASPCEGRRDLCGQCLADLPWNIQSCSVCALPLASSQKICGACLASPPAFECRAVFRYAFPMDRLLARLKYHGHLTPARVLGELLAEFLIEDDTPRPDLLLPVPLHDERLRERGYNQATELARPLARALGLPLEHRLITRVKATAMQKGLSADERERNLRRAFSIDQERYRALGSPKSVAIIDDVVTTGATIEALARVLREAGVEQVQVWALARTP